MKSKEYFMVLRSIKKHIKGSIFDGHVYAVGGGVRDLIMGYDISDVDLVVDIKDGGIRLAEFLKSKDLLDGDIVTYKRFGTAMFRLKEYKDVEMESVCTRKEVYDGKSRKPEVDFGTIEEDAFRRDFTINALYINISSAHSNEIGSEFKVTDPTGMGCDDINNRILRVTGDPEKIFTDDPLRVFRAVRFAAKYSLILDKSIGDAFAMKSVRDKIPSLSTERIRDEFIKMIMGDNHSYALYMLAGSNLLCFVSHVLAAMYWINDIKKVAGVKGNLFFDACVCLKDSPKKLETRLAVLYSRCSLAFIGAEFSDGLEITKDNYAYVSACMAMQDLKYMKFSKKVGEKVSWMIQNQITPYYDRIKFKAPSDEDIRLLQMRCGMNEFKDLLEFLASSRKNSGKAIASMVMKKSMEMIMNRTDMFDYKMPIDGNDVMEVTGGSGKTVGMIMGILKSEAISHPEYLKTKEDYIGFMMLMQHFGPKTLYRTMKKEKASSYSELNAKYKNKKYQK